MTNPREPLACPWCSHESPDGDDFRTHLMVEHRKSDLARYVLDDQRPATVDRAGSERRADQPADGEDERELVVR